MLGTVLALGLHSATADIRLNENCSPKDLELAEQCEQLCIGSLKDCVEDCEDEPCKSDCYRDEIKCVDACPCHTDCYDGCEACSNDICFEEDPCDVGRP